MAIEVNIKKEFEGFQLEISFRSESKRIGILGASGCGKSLTLKSIAGIEEPDSGRIALGENVLYDSSQKKNLSPQKRNVGYLFQNYALFPTMTVEKNIGIGLKCGKEERKEKVLEMIKRFHLEGLEHRLPNELSGGQQQRVALARILIYEPDVILLDEPFSALDVYLKDQMQRECMDVLKDYPGTVILVSHSRDEIYRFSEEALVIDQGKIVGQKPTRQLFENPEKISVARLTGCKNIANIEVEENRIHIPAWNIALEKTKENCWAGVHAVGIRAHEFEIVKPEEECLEVRVLQPKITEDMFEYTVSFLPDAAGEARLDWKISKYLWKFEEQGVPEKIYLRKSKLLWLS